MSRASNLHLVDFWYQRMWNHWDKGVIAEIADPTLTFRTSLGRAIEGHAALAAYMDFVHAAFPDFHNEVEETLCDGDKVFARLTYTGTHEGEIFGVAPTRRRVAYAGAAVFTCAGQRIHGVWVLGDVHGLLAQLRGTGGAR